MPGDHPRGDADRQPRRCVAAAHRGAHDAPRSIAAEDTRTTVQLMRALGIENRPRLIALHEHNETRARGRARRARPRRRRARAVGCRHADRERPRLRAGAGGDRGRRDGHARSPDRAPCSRRSRSAACRPTGSRSRASCRARDGCPRCAPWHPRPARWCSSSRRTGSATRSRDLATAFGPDRPAAVCRELTKLYEEVVRGTLAELAERFAEGARGEIVVVVGGAAPASASLDDGVRAGARTRRRGVATQGGGRRGGRATGLSRRDLYEAALRAK